MEHEDLEASCNVCLGFPPAQCSRGHHHPCWQMMERPWRSLPAILELNWWLWRLTEWLVSVAWSVTRSHTPPIPAASSCCQSLCRGITVPTGHVVAAAALQAAQLVINYNQLAIRVLITAIDDVHLRHGYIKSATTLSKYFKVMHLGLRVLLIVLFLVQWRTGLLFARAMLC